MRLLLSHSGLLLFNEHPSGAAKAGKRFLDKPAFVGTNDKLNQLGWLNLEQRSRTEALGYLHVYKHVKKTNFRLIGSAKKHDDIRYMLLSFQILEYFRQRFENLEMNLNVKFLTSYLF